MRRWSESEYELLFRNHPPTDRHAPTATECAGIGSSIGRTAGAIASQWDDGRSLVLGQRNAASAGLAAWLSLRGWLGDSITH